jgi:hypothetical protein
MRKLTTSILLGAALAGFATNAEAKVLGVTLQYQEKENWCWAATSQMISRYHNRYFVEQCEIAELARSKNPSAFGNTNCCLDPDEACNNQNLIYDGDGSIEDILETLNVDSTGVLGPMYYESVKAQIDASQPFIIRWKVGHFVVIHGYLDDGADGLLYVLDPWFGEGASAMAYEEVRSTRWWTHTLTSVAPNPANDAVTLYEHDGYQGIAHTTSASESYVGGGFNNKASSVKVKGVPYILYEYSNYSGAGWPLNPNNYSSSVVWRGANDAVSSAMKLPGANQSIGIVLFDGENYTGAYKVITGDDSALASSGWNDRASSLIVLNKIWHLYTGADYGGAPYAVTSFGGPNHDGFYPNASSWGGVNNDVSSVYWIPESWSPILLFADTNLSGRAVALWPGSSSDWQNNFQNLAFNDSVSSIKTYGDTWTVYCHGNQQGTAHELAPNTWYREPSEWGGGDNEISSVSYSDSNEWYPTR